MKPWEHVRSHANTTPKRRPTLEERVAELLIRFELGHFDERVRDRLAEIFRAGAPDAWERLEKACEYLSVTGENPDSFLRRKVREFSR